MLPDASFCSATEQRKEALHVLCQITRKMNHLQNAVKQCSTHSSWFALCLTGPFCCCETVYQQICHHLTASVMGFQNRDLSYNKHGDVLCVVFSSALEVFQHHRHFPLFVWRADEPARAHSCRDRLHHRSEWMMMRQFVCLPFIQTNVHKVLHRKQDLENSWDSDWRWCLWFVFLQVWKVKKAFKIQVSWKGGKPVFQVCVLCNTTYYLYVDHFL